MAADGVVDFRDARPSDRLWDLRLRWLVTAYADSRRGDVALARHMRYTGALGTDDAKLFEQAWKLSGQTLADLDAALRPWLEHQRQLTDADAGLMEQFRRVIGDMSDPTFRAEMDRIAESILADLPAPVADQIRADARRMAAEADVV